MNSLTNNNILISTAVVCVLTAISGGIIYMIRSNRSRKYVKVAKVFKLIIYPVKSLPGIEVNEVDITKSGIKFGPFRDRSWMLVTDENRFITQRQESSLALLKTSFNRNQLWIDGPNLPTLKLDVITERQSNQIVVQTKVWGQTIEGIHCGEEAEKWFSKYLNKPGTKLIQHIPQLKMRGSGAQIKDKVKTLQKFPIVFQDGSGVLLMNQKSIDDLNEKLSAEQRVSAKNFRPNILVSDCNALEEDNWMYLKIRDIEFAFLKPCERCVLTTINPESGLKNGTEPLTTLRTYRLADQNLRKLYGTNPLFGVNFGPLNEGQIYCGDEILAVNSIS